MFSPYVQVLAVYCSIDSFHDVVHRCVVVLECVEQIQSRDRTPRVYCHSQYRFQVLRLPLLQNDAYNYL